MNRLIKHVKITIELDVIADEVSITKAIDDIEASAINGFLDEGVSVNAAFDHITYNATSSTKLAFSDNELSTDQKIVDDYFDNGAYYVILNFTTTDEVKSNFVNFVNNQINE